MALASIWHVVPNSIIPYANYWWVIGSKPILTIIPFHLPSSLSSLILLPIASTMIMNKKWDSGSPHLRPFEVAKKPCEAPFTRIENLGVDTQLLFHFIQLPLKPKLSSFSTKNYLSTRSYAFSISSLRIIISIIPFLAKCIASCAIIKPSTIDLPREKT